MEILNGTKSVVEFIKLDKCGTTAFTFILGGNCSFFQVSEFRKQAK
jgi:hypothetical protein